MRGLLISFELHSVGSVATDLHPQPVDMIPVLRRQDLGHLGSGHRLAPHADRFGDDLDAGMLGEDFFRRLGAQRVHRSAGHAGDDDDVALAAELVDQPFGGLALKLAVEALEGKTVPKTTILPLPLVTNDTIKLCQEGTWQEMKAGCNAFKPAIVTNPGWFASIFSDQTPEIGLDAALVGQPEH